MGAVRATCAHGKREEHGAEWSPGDSQLLTEISGVVLKKSGTDFSGSVLKEDQNKRSNRML